VRLKGGGDFGQHPPGIVQHGVVGEAQHTQPLRLQELLANGVFFRCIVVNRPVNLDHQRRFRAVKVQDKAVKGVLAAELGPGQTAIAQLLPQPILRRGGIAPHLAGQRLEHLPQTGRDAPHPWPLFISPHPWPLATRPHPWPLSIKMERGRGAGG